MKKNLLFAIAICLVVIFSSCSLLLRRGANMAVESVQTAATAENPNALQQATANVTSSLQQATANNPGLQQATSFFGQVTGFRSQPPPGAQETICNDRPCFTSTCGQFELVSVVGDSLTQEVTITLLITQRMQASPIRHTLPGILAIDEEGNSYEMMEPAAENDFRNLPQNVPVRVIYRRIGPVPTTVERFIFVQAANWNGAFEGGCSPTFRDVPIVWQ